MLVAKNSCNIRDGHHEYLDTWLPSQAYRKIRLGTKHSASIFIVGTLNPSSFRAERTAAMGRFLPVKTSPCAGHIRCKWLVKPNANRWSNQCNYPRGTVHGVWSDHSGKQHIASGTSQGMRKCRRSRMRGVISSRMTVRRGRGPSNGNTFGGG